MNYGQCHVFEGEMPSGAAILKYRQQLISSHTIPNLDWRLHPAQDRMMERPKDRARQETSNSHSSKRHNRKEQQKSMVREDTCSHHMGDILVNLTINPFDHLNIRSLLTDQEYPFLFFACLRARSRCLLKHQTLSSASVAVSRAQPIPPTLIARIHELEPLQE